VNTAWRHDARLQFSDATKFVRFFLDHLKHNIFFQNNSFFMGNKIDTGMQEQ